MIRLSTALLLLPSMAVAEWTPRPAMFNYEATFAQCIANQEAPDLAFDCANLLADAYVLKRAVAWGALNCEGQDLLTCASPFENEGLPHIAMQIAVGIGCDATELSTFDPELPLDPDHCVSVASDIMIDEGVVPLVTEVRCTDETIECDDLAAIHVQLWEDEILNIIGEDPLIPDLMDLASQDCTSRAEGDTDAAANRNGLACIADEFASIWADLSQAIK